MAKETEVWEVIKNAGYDPVLNRSIIVSYAPANLSATIANFFSNEFYVLQICKNELVLVPFGKISMNLKKEVALEIPLESIRSIEIAESGLNYNIAIEMGDDKITLTTQQKELSDLRSAGMLAGLITLNKNWHKDNLDDTLEELKKLAR